MSRPALFPVDPARLCPTPCFIVRGRHPARIVAARPVRSSFQATERLSPGAVAAGGAVTQTLSGERPAGLRTTRAEPFQARTAPSVRQGLVCPRKQTAKCGAEL